MRDVILILLASLFSAIPQARAEEYVQPREVSPDRQSPLPGTERLTIEGDIASQMIDGVDRFLLMKLEESVQKRARHWKRDFSSAEAYSKSIYPNRKQLAHILGMRAPRLSFEAPELVETTKDSAIVAKGKGYEIRAIRWPVLSDPGPAISKAVCIHGEGLLAVPISNRAVANVIVIPDADQTPEQWFGLESGLPPESQVARRLAESGCRVVVPTLITRELKQYRGAKLTNREFLYRSAFELGRHLIGYELQKVLALVDWFEMGAGDENSRIGLVGYGEGGGLALYAAALDPRIEATCVSGYFDNRNDVWRQPIDRNVFGLLDQFGDAELASMIAPRALYISNAAAPMLELPGNGGAPARLAHPEEAGVIAEFRRASELIAPFRGKVHWSARASGRTLPGPKARPENKDAPRPLLGLMTLESFLTELDPALKPAEIGDPPTALRKIDADARQSRQIAEIDRFNQLLLAESPYVRAEFMKKLDTTSLDAYEKSVEWYREYFATEVIGRFDDMRLPPSPRTRKVYETDHWDCYEVVLDVWPDVFAYGLLLVPKELKGGDRRPVVVCQHGLEGRPQDTIGPQGSGHYSAFAGRLAERGFVTFAPQNIYIFRDRFRTLQRKANPLGKTLFSIMVPQHQQITDWLKTLPFVDGDRIAFYGLSYGGKSAMRIPPLVKNYCLSICSADFNEWVWKNASSRSPYSYADKGEYEIFEFDLGSTFNYSEMAALIAPRPFMVERGHFDTVAPDETVAHEFAKVQNLYNARLKLPPDRCRIEWFVGPHKINAVGTFEFLHHHLKWPTPSEP